MDVLTTRQAAQDNKVNRVKLNRVIGIVQNKNKLLLKKLMPYNVQTISYS